MKKTINRDDCLKRELGHLAGLIGGLTKNKGWCFLGGVIPQC